MINNTNKYSLFWDRFKSNRRNLYSLYIFSFIFILSLFAEVISNDKPIMMSIDDKIYIPILISYPETEFGGIFDTEANYKDSFMSRVYNENDNWVIFPINPHSYNSINLDNATPNPASPSSYNYLGTDDRGRDVLARLIYGFRLSVIFAFILTLIGVIIGIFFGAIQGYFAGRTDLYLQRFIEIWSSMPELYILIIFSSLFEPSILLLIILLSLFGWMGLSDYVRAEFLKGRNMEYVIAARTMGLSNTQIILHPLTTVELGEIEKAKDIARKLKDDKFYKFCMETTQKRYNMYYSEKVFLKHFDGIMKTL